MVERKPNRYRQFLFDCFVEKTGHPPGEPMMPLDKYKKVCEECRLAYRKIKPVKKEQKKGKQPWKLRWHKYWKKKKRSGENG